MWKRERMTEKRTERQRQTSKEVKQENERMYDGRQSVVKRIMERLRKKALEKEIRN